MKIKKKKYLIDNLKQYASKSRFVTPLVIFFITLAIYTHNLSPSVYGGDSGDILSASWVWGVPHPSGYPLITLLGGIFMHFLPYGSTPAWKFGFLDSLISSGAVVIMYLIVKSLTKNKILSIFSAFTLAFAFPFWLYAEVAEVIALHNFFILLLIWLTLNYTQKKSNKNLFLLTFFCGLSLTNNQAILLLFPAIAITILLVDVKLASLLKSFLFFLTGLVVYIYIPISAIRYPKLNTGFAVNLKNFWYLVSRHYYGWGSTSSETFNLNTTFTNFQAYFDYFNIYFGLTVMILAIIGIIALFFNKKRHPTVLLLTSLFFLTFFYIFYSRLTTFNSANRAVLEKFYVQTTIVPLILMPFGINFSINFIGKFIKHSLLRKVSIACIYAILIIQPFSYLIKNIEKLDFSNVNLGNDFAKDIMVTASPGSVVLPQDDSMGYVVLYNQTVLDQRTDVELPGLHDGYSFFVKKMFPDKATSRNFIIEHQGILDSDTIIQLIPRIMLDQNVYSVEPIPSMEINGKKVVPVPYGLLSKLEFIDNFDLSKDKYLSKVEQITSNYHINGLVSNKSKVNDQFYLLHIKEGYVLAFSRIANFILLQYHDEEAAKKYMDIALKLSS